MKRTRRFRRGIYLLPTLFTIGNLFCGYSSVVAAFDGRYGRAALYIIIAGVLDGLDGRIARMTGTASEFGLQFDSLADCVSFGLAPAVLARTWALGTLERVGSWIAFLFLVCAAMRLARFNLRKHLEDRRYFAGLPSPIAAGTLACFAYAFPARQEATAAAVALALFVSLLGLLMVSRLRYRSFKELDWHRRRSYVYVLPLAAALVGIVIYPAWGLPLAATVYMLSAPASNLWSLARRRGRSAASAESEVRDEPAFR